MTEIGRGLLWMAVLATVSGAEAAPAVAQGPQAQVQHAAVRLVVVPEPRSNVSVTVAHGPNRLPALSVRQEGGRVIVDGGLQRPFGQGPGGISCHKGPENDGWVEVAGVGRIAYSDLPVVTAHVPLDARVSGQGAVYGQVGAARSLDLANAGCGDWSLASVQGRLAVTEAGSGDVQAADAGQLQAHLGGSGDLGIGRIADGAVIVIGGSGDVRGAAVRGPLKLSVAGSGDVRIGHVDGPIQAELAGSGDVHVSEGRAPSVQVQTSGSAEFDFGGEAGRVQVASSGSGDVHIAHASGPVSQASSGNGEIQIGR
jgi:hypothetical protein